MKTNKIPGIYLIVNVTNGKFYVGSAKNLGNRFATHKKDLRKNQHHNIHLQSAWNKYGANSFYFLVLEFLNSPDQLFDREQFYLDYYKPYIKGIGYNKSTSARTSLGVKPSLETRKKQSESAKRRFMLNPQTRAEESHMSKLTWDIVSQIRKLYSTWEYSQKDLGIKFNIGSRHVCDILAGKYWNDGSPPIKKYKKVYLLTEQQKEEIISKYIPFVYTARMLANEYSVPEFKIKKLFFKS